MKRQYTGTWRITDTELRSYLEAISKPELIEFSSSIDGGVRCLGHYDCTRAQWR